METQKELKTILVLLAVFLTAFFLPTNNQVFLTAIYATLDLIKWYAQEHVILCLLPAFFIAGVISVFLSQASVLKYLGANAKKIVSYSVAAVSGSILAVCSCTVLPLFSSIHKKGAGLGPAIAFLYSGPAINILAIVLTTKVIGVEMGIARVIGAVSFSIIIGAIMSLIYRKEELQKKEEQMKITPPPSKRPFWQTIFHFFTLVLILVFANWGKPDIIDHSSILYIIWQYKWYITSFWGILFAFSLYKFLKINLSKIILSAIFIVLTVLISGYFIQNAKFQPLLPMFIATILLGYLTFSDKNDSDNKEWAISSWDYAKQIMPLLGLGIVIAGFLLGSTHDGKTIPGIIPNQWIYWAVGGNGFLSNLFASVVGAFMYFATLTEIPIIQGLMAAGMGKGPALALFLAGPSLSLPNMLVIRKVLGTEKTVIYVTLVIVMATITGYIYGTFF